MGVTSKIGIPRINMHVWVIGICEFVSDPLGCKAITYVLFNSASPLAVYVF